MNLISLLNLAFKEPGDTPGAGCNDVNSKYVPGARRRGGKIAAKGGRKEERRLEGEKAIARAADGGRLGRTKRPKEPVLPKPRGENTITPLLGGGIMNLSLAT